MKRSPLPSRKANIARSVVKRTSDGLQDGRISRPRVPGEVKRPSKVVGVPNRTSGALQRVSAGKRKPLRFGGIPQNTDYLEFVRCFPCILTDLRVTARTYVRNPRELNGPIAETTHVCSGKIEAAHTGRRGMKQKAADETALPMCVNAHRTGKYAHHRLGKNFWSFWGLDQAKLIQSFNEMARESEVLVQEFKS